MARKFNPARMRLRWKGEAVGEKGKRAAELGMKVTLGECVRIAIRRAPVAYGTLGQSIRIDKMYWRHKQLFGRWGAFVKYALWVEVGTGPHMPPVDAIRDWAAQKLGAPELAWPIAIAISKRGTREQPFLRPAADEAYPKLADNVKAAWGKV